MFALLVAVAAALLSWQSLTAWTPLEAPSVAAVAGIYAQVAVTMLGFMLAMLAILVSVADRRAIRNISRTGHFRKLLIQLYQAAAYFGVTLVTSVVSMMVVGPYLPVVAAASNGAMIGATWLVITTGRFLWKVLALLLPEDGSRLE